MSFKIKLLFKNRFFKRIFVDMILVIMLLASCSIFLVDDVLAGWDEQEKLLPSDGEESDEFGCSVSVYGDYALVGVKDDDDNGDNSGSAYVFYNDGGVWTQQAKLLPDDGDAGDFFGYSVYLYANYASVGAWYADDNGDNSGSAYIFERSGSSWSQQAKLLPDDGSEGDHFGNSVSLYGDYALVGVKDDDDNGDNSGSAYVFYNDGGVWTQQAKLLADDGSEYDCFGGSVSLYGDYALVGAEYNGLMSGSAYVFYNDGGIWTQQAKLLPDDGSEGDHFGNSVSLYGDYSLIGAYYVDSNGESSAGSAYVFYNDGGVWTQQAKLLADDGSLADHFGNSVSLYGDYSFIGAFFDDPNGAQSGSAYIFIFTNNPPDAPSTPTGTNSVTTGTICTYSTSATDPDGDQVFYKFNWGDGTDSGWVGPYSSGETGSASHSWSSAGTYHVSAVTKDSNDEESGSSGYLIVSAGVQELPVLSYSPTEINFDPIGAGSTDSEAFDIWNSGTGTLTYSFSETVDWIEINPSSGSSTGEHDTISVNVANTDDMEGYYSGLISVSSDGGNGSVFVDITIGSSQANNPPDADAGGPYTGVIDDDVIFIGQGTDTDGTIAYYRWDFDNDGSYDTEWSDENKATYNYSSAGIYTVTFQVMDDLGANGTGTATVTITEKDSSDTNVPPTADAGRSYSGTVNEKIMFTGYGTDIDGTIAYYRWDFDNDGSYDTEWSDSSIANHSYTSAGIYTVTLQVMDDLGANGTGTATVTITGDGGIPGFELVLVFCALIIVFYIIRKRRNM